MLYVCVALDSRVTHVDLGALASNKRAAPVQNAML